MFAVKFVNKRRIKTEQ